MPDRIPHLPGLPLSHTMEHRIVRGAFEPDARIFPGQPDIEASSTYIKLLSTFATHVYRGLAEAAVTAISDGSFLNAGRPARRGCFRMLRDGRDVVAQTCPVPVQDLRPAKSYRLITWAPRPDTADLAAIKPRLRQSLSQERSRIPRLRRPILKSSVTPTGGEDVHSNDPQGHHLRHRHGA